MRNSHHMTAAHAGIDVYSQHLLRCKPYSYMMFLLDLIMRIFLLTLMRCKAKSSSKASSCSNACQGCCAECDATLMACSSTYLPLLRVKASSSTCIHACQSTNVYTTCNCTFPAQPRHYDGSMKAGPMHFQTAVSESMSSIVCHATCKAFWLVYISIQ